MRAVLYAAKSTEDKHGSIPDQLADGRELAAQRSFEVAAEFQDEAASAFHGDRGPGLAGAMAACEQLAPCVLIVQHSDRLARGDAKQARHLIEVVLWAIKTDVQLLSVQDPEMLAGGDMALLLGAIGGMRNHQDSKRKSLAVKDGMRRRAERGKLSAGPRPYGYRWSEGGLVVVPAEAEVVLRLYEQMVAGMSQRALSRSLNDDGIPTISGRRWAQSTIAHLLANPLYKGLIRHDGQEYPGEHEPIVSRQLWDRAATLRTSAARRKGGRRPKGSHLLTGGLLRCSCGYAMVPRTDRNGYEVYECRGRREHGPGFCQQGSVRRRLVDETMLAELTSRWIDLDETHRRLGARHDADLTMARGALGDAERDLLRKQEAQSRVERDYLDGKLPAEDWARFRARLADELEGAQRALYRAQDHVDALEQAGPLQNATEALLEQLSALKRAVAEGVERAPDLNALRLTVRTLFREVLLTPRDHPKAILALGGAGAAAMGDYWLIPRAHKSALYAALVAGLPPLPQQTDQDTLTR